MALIFWMVSTTMQVSILELEINKDIKNAKCTFNTLYFSMNYIFTFLLFL